MRTGKTFADTEEAVYKSYEVVKNKFTGATENTTIGAVITNAAFPKSSLCKIAGMAHDGYARAIRPVHTSSDGDSIYALSVGDVKADQDMVGTLGAQVMAEAILRAVRARSRPTDLLERRIYKRAAARQNFADMTAPFSIRLHLSCHAQVRTSSISSASEIPRSSNWKWQLWCGEG